MEVKVMKFTANMLLITLVIFGGLLLKLPDIRAWELSREAIDVVEEEPETSNEDMNELELKDTEVVSEMQHMQLRLTLPQGVAPENIEISNHYLTQTVRIVIPHTDDSYFESHPIAGSSDHIAGLAYAQGSKSDIIEIKLDQVYELEQEYDESYYYLDFIEPSALYDKVIVVDAGHGGRDSGAERQGIYEKDINLDILLELKELLDETEENIGVYYTRVEDENPSHEQRVQLANKVKADLFISIHNNSYKGRYASSIKGTEVMYSESQEGEFASKQFAKICLEELTNSLGSRDRGLLKGDTIYIINRSKVPVALVEVGFMTHKEELKLLNSEEYQKKAAEGIYAAILRAFKEGF